jgi:hypothetical protein
MSSSEHCEGQRVELRALALKAMKTLDFHLDLQGNEDEIDH